MKVNRVIEANIIAVIFCAVSVCNAFAVNTITTSGWSPTGTTNINEYTAYTLTLNTSPALKTSSVTSSTAYVKTGNSCSGGTLAGNVAVSATGGTPTSTITFTPTAAYTSSQQYTLCVKSGSSGIKDTGGGTMGSDATQTFTVRDYIPPYLSSYTPNVPVVSSTTPSISLTFDEPMTTSTVTTSSVKLTNTTDNTTVSLTGPSWSGSNAVATFTPTSLVSLKNYQVTLDGTQKDVAGNLINCSGSNVCSWGFAVDSTPPTVTAYSPNTAYVRTTNPVISATFSQPIDTSTLTSTNFSLKQGSTSVGGTISYNSATNMATYSPTSALSDGNSYAVTLTTSIKDTASPTPNALSSNISWTFIVDVTPPVVASVSPASGAANIAVTSPIVIKFTEANGMLASTINGSSAVLTDSSGNVIACTISYNSTTKTLTLTPGTSLNYNTTYTITLNNGTYVITDLAGNQLSGNQANSSYSWNFTTQSVPLSDYTVYPSLMCQAVTPNVLIILDNSNSIDEDLYNNAIGSPHCSNLSDPNTCSKSILARLAMINMINSYANSIRIGIMSYKLPSVSKYYLHNNVYFNSYDPRSYCPNPPQSCNDYCVKEDPQSGNNYTPSTNEANCNTACQQQNALFQANYRDAITTTAGTSGNNGTAINSAKRSSYCSLIYPKTQQYTDPNHVTVYYGMPGTLYDTSNDGTRYAYSSSYSSTEYPAQTDNYYVCTGKSGTSDTSGYSGCSGPTGFVPSDDDYALGFYDFGPRNYWYYTSQTWFATSSPGGGYLNVPIATNVAPGNTQLNSLLTALGGNRTPAAFQNDEAGYMSCTNTSNPNACSYILNAGLTPTAGTFQTAINYFNGFLVQGSSVPSPIQYPCQKNFIIYVTDGSPSVDESGNANTASALMPTVLSKVNALRCPASPTSSNCKVSYNSTNYDVITYVLGLGLSSVDQANINSIASTGGTTAYYANSASDLTNGLISIFNDILSQVTSGTAASILNNSQGSGAALLQAVFYPSRTFNNSTKVSWIGEMQNLWYYLDPNLQTTSIREDTNQDNILELTHDKITQFYFSSTQNVTLVNRYSDSNGDGIADSSTPDDTVTPDQVNSLWKAGQLLWKRNVTTDPRTFYTGFQSVGGSTPQKFSPNAADGFVTSSTAWNLLQIPPGSNDYRQAKAATLINYMLGTDQPADSDGTQYRSRQVTITGCGLTDTEQCTREWKLGDIVSSTPRLASNIEVGSYDQPSPIGYNDTSYANFVNSSTYKTRGMAFVGGNDGMLHAFKLGVLKELTGKNVKAQINDANGNLATAATKLGHEDWTFIPQNALPYLKYYADPSYDHIFYVDRTPTLVDASIGTPSDPTQCSGGSYSTCAKMSDGSSWRTVLIGGMGFGGASRFSTGSCNSTVNGLPNCVLSPIAGGGLSSYFALDVTDPANPKYLWEFAGDPASPGSLGNSTTGPIVVRVAAKDVNGNTDNSKNGQWLAVFASGPTGPINTTNHQYLGQSDQNLKIFIVDLSTGTLLKTIDSGLTNAFAGSLATSSIDADRWNSSLPGYYSDDAIYIGYTQLDPSTNTWTKGGVLRLSTRESDPTTTDPSKQWTLSTLISGTGPVTTSITKLQDRTNHNLWIYFGTGRYFYKGDDTSSTQQKLYGIKEPCYTTNDNISPTCTTAVTGSLVDQSGTATTAPSATISSAAPGWSITLDAPDSSNYSERVITDSVSTGSGAVFFTTFKPNSSPCQFGGNSLIWAVNYSTGAAPPSTAMQGQALMQVSTGAFANISLSTAFANPGNARLDGRRLSTPVSGVPPSAQGLSLVVKPRPLKKILQIREK